MSPLALAVLLSLPLSAGAQSFDFAAAKAVPQAPARVDLSGQFGDAPRKQGKIASCHTFVAVALIEAAYFRRYGRRVRLSEADLFVRRNAAPALPYLRARDSGMLRPDLRFALKFGVNPFHRLEVGLRGLGVLGDGSRREGGQQRDPDGDHDLQRSSPECGFFTDWG